MTDYYTFTKDIDSFGNFLNMIKEKNLQRARLYYMSGGGLWIDTFYLQIDQFHQDEKTQIMDFEMLYFHRDVEATFLSADFEYDPNTEKLTGDWDPYGTIPPRYRMSVRRVLSNFFK